MDGPVLRISQAGSNDLVSVSNYYSNELISFIRNVLQVIPETIFELLDQIIDLQTNKIQEVPTRLEKERLKEFSQLDERFEVARYCQVLPDSERH